MLTGKEAQLVHFQDLCERHEAELTRVGEAVAAAEAQVGEMRAEMVRKESAW